MRTQLSTPHGNAPFAHNAYAPKREPRSVGTCRSGLIPACTDHMHKQFAGRSRLKIFKHE